MTRPHRILVVEDTPAYAEALERTLALEGHEVLLATRAQEALARARHEPPDLVLLDLGLPDRDGYHVLRALRALARARQGRGVPARRGRLRDQAVRRARAAGPHLGAAPPRARRGSSRRATRRRGTRARRRRAARALQPHGAAGRGGAPHGRG